MIMIKVEIIEGCIMFAGCNRRGSFPRLSSSDGKQGLSVFQSKAIRQNPSQRSTKNLYPSTSKRLSLSLTM